MEDSVQDDLHDATMKEVDIGTLHGPYSATGGYRTLWIFFLCGRSRSKTRSLHMREQFEIKNSSLWSCRMANQKTRTKHKSNQTKRRHADPPTRFAFRHAAEKQSKKRKRQGRTKTTTNKDLPWTQWYCRLYSHGVATQKYATNELVATQ